MKRIITLLVALVTICAAGFAEGICTVLQAAESAETVSVGLKATSGDKKVKLSWNAAEGASSYTVYWKRSSSNAWKKLGTTKRTVVNVTDLINGRSYDFKIAFGKSETAKVTITPSDKKTVTAYAADPEKPEDPKIETAAEAVANMDIGYNIGNSFDSMGGHLPKTATPAQHETAWGNPQISKSLVDSIAKQGFKAVRLPVTWGFNADEKGNIRKEWLDRVQEVVDLILDADMYCIINVHHDTGTDGWIHVSKNSFESAKDRFGTIWTQIAERFKDYGEKLIFECMNETLNDSNDWGATDKTSAEYITKYQQIFVDNVRKTGGNNAERNLVVSTYAASSSSAVVNAFVLPKDSAKDHLIMEVHNYDPAGFVRTEAGWTTLRDTWGTSQDKKDVENLMNTLAKKGEDLGVPVIIGEFGSMNKGNESDRVAHAAYNVKTAAEKGIVIFWWDNGCDNAQYTEPFALFDRYSAKVTHPDIVEALINNAK